MLLFLIQSSKAKTVDGRKQAFTNLFGSLLEVGNALNQEPPPEKPGIFQSIGLHLRWIICLQTIAMINTLISVEPEARAWISNDDLRQVLRIGDLALRCIQAIRNKMYYSLSKRMTSTRRRLSHAYTHILLGAAYVNLGVGDMSRSLETAYEHYWAAMRILESEAHPALALYAANAWTAMGEALLEYPAENRNRNAQQALEVLLKAREIVAPFAAVAKSPPEIMRDSAQWRKLPLSTRLPHAARHTFRLTAGNWRMMRKGVMDPFVAGEATPFVSAAINLQIGKAYHRLGNLEKAVEHFDLALRDWREDPDGRAAIEMNKADAYLEIQQGDRRENLKHATDIFEGVVAEQKSFRFQWTLAKALLGDARVCLELDAIGTWVAEERAKVLDAMSKNLRIAARIFRATVKLQLLQEALFLLGKLRLLQKDYCGAYRALEAAARVAERIERSVRTVRSLHYLVGERAALDEQLVSVAVDCLLFSRQCQTPAQNAPEVSQTPKATAISRLSWSTTAISRLSWSTLSSSLASWHSPSSAQRTTSLTPRRAFALAERGRTVLLRAQLSRLNLLPKGAVERDLQRLFGLRRAWHEAELRLLERETSLVTEGVVKLQKQRRALESAYSSELDKIRSKFSDAQYDPDRPMPSFRPDVVDSRIMPWLERQRTALVEYYITERSLFIFIILPTQLKYLHLAEFSRKDLNTIEEHWRRGNASLQAVGSPSYAFQLAHWERGYLRQVLERLKPAAKAAATVIEEWKNATGGVIERIIIVPHRFLHLVPWHAIELSPGQMWGDSYFIQYVPSASVLTQLLSSHRTKTREATDESSGEAIQKALCVAYSPPDKERTLPFGMEEARAVASATRGQLIFGHEATPQNVKELMRDATYVHFTCHGTFRQDAPLDSALELAPRNQWPVASSEGSADGPHGMLRAQLNGYLTLGEIFKDVDLSGGPLVVLSACETGLTKPDPRHEEYIGFPGAFLFAGASTVVSSLWQVPDVATWLLMRTFSEKIATGTGTGTPATKALRIAQENLRHLPLHQIQDEIKAATEREDDVSKRERMIEEGQLLRPLGEFPFAGPYWWAGFTVSGL